MKKPIFFLFEKWNSLFTAEDSPRRPGYIGKLPYLLVLRWFTVLGMLIRVLFHTADENLLLGVVSLTSGLLLAGFLTVRRRKEPERSGTLALVALDITIFSIAYLATRRLQSDMFLFYFLPLITAVEHLRGRLVAVVYGGASIALAAVIFSLCTVDGAARMSPAEALVRVYMGRDFFFLGLVTTGWYLFRLERLQYLSMRERRVLVEKARDELRARQLLVEKAHDELRALFDFSLQTEKLFAAKDVLNAAVELAVKTLDADFGIALWEEGNGVQHQGLYPLSDESARLAVPLWSARLDENFQVGEAPEVEQKVWIHEYLELAQQRMGVLAVAVSSPKRLLPEAQGFLQALKGPLINALRRGQILSALRIINRETLKTLEFDRQLDSVLREATEGLHMEFATVTLKDEYRGVVETIRGRNVPPGLLRRSRYKLTERDIQTEVIRTGGTRFIDGPNELFNSEIFERFEHHKLARLWVPLRSLGEVLGTIEVGCNSERREVVQACQAKVEQLGRTYGRSLSVVRPQSLLHLIAEQAIRLVNADSASIHVFQSSGSMNPQILSSISTKELAEFFQRDSPLLAAGAGKADARFIQRHRPRVHGIGWQAILALLREQPDSYRVVEGEELRELSPDIYEEGIRALMAMPLKVAPDVVGVLYIDDWSDRHFSQEEIQLERVFAAQIEVAIQSHLLLTSTTSAAQDSRNLLEWLSVIQAPAVFEESFAVLEELARKLLLVADADNVVLYPFSKQEKRFLAPPIYFPKLRDEDAMQDKVGPDHIVTTLLREKPPHFFEDIGREKPEFLERVGPRARFIEREGIKSCAVLPLRASPGDDQELFGMLFVNYRRCRQFNTEQKRTMETLAGSAAAVIRTTRFFEWQKRRKEHLEALAEIDQAIVEGARKLNADQILDSILTEAVHVSKAPRGVVWKRVSDQELEAVAAYPTPTPMKGRRVRLDADLSDFRFADGSADSAGRSRVDIRIEDDKEILGVISLEGDREGCFSEEDVTVLNSLAVQAKIALHSISTYRELVTEQNRAVALSRIATRIHSYPIELVQYLILTGITAGPSLGFSRAMLFLRQEQSDSLRGICGIGATTRAVATDTWQHYPLEKSVDELLDDAIQHFQKVCSAGQDFFFSAVQQIDVPLRASEGVVARCVLDRLNGAAPGATEFPSFYPIGYQVADPFRQRLATATGCADEGIPFACVPLVGREEVVGAIVVDNRFLEQERNLIEPDLAHRLAAYAELAAMSIESARLAERTQTRTYEDLAHQVKQPIRQAKHFCDQFSRTPGGSPKRYSLERSLKAAIAKADHVSMSLNHYANLARGKPLKLDRQLVTAYDLRDLLRETKADFMMLIDPEEGRDLVIEEDSFDRLRYDRISVDTALFREVVDDLVDNAYKYGYKNTLITIRADSAERRRYLDIVVENTGIPITPEDLPHVAERYWRGKESASVTAEGDGIGLWVVDAIMRAHDGFLVPMATKNFRTQFRLRFLVADGGTTA